MDYRDHFTGKKITMMGLGLLGRGIGVAKFLAESGAEILITDLKTKDQLASALSELESFGDSIKYILGEHRLEDFRDRDLIIKAAGVPLDSIYIAEAKKYNIPIKMDASLFCELTQTKNIIGVTGTKGKSTVTQLIYEILKAANKRVFLGGNVRGVATLPLLYEVGEDDFVVLELDSWQLQGFGDTNISPRIAIFTNIMSDHQDYYSGDMKRYFMDKANIYLNQNKEDYLVIGPTVEEYLVNQPKAVQPLAEKIIYSESDLPDDWKLNMKGIHNRENAAGALATSKILSISEDIAKDVITNFSGVSGRLSLVADSNGVEFYNDTTATIPNATIAALDAFDKQVILIAGGTDKKSDYTTLAKKIVKKVKRLILFPGSGTDKLIPLLPKDFVYEQVNSMEEAVRIGINSAQEDDTILLSPAAASFKTFENEYDRGDQFVQEVKKWITR